MNGFKLSRDQLHRDTVFMGDLATCPCVGFWWFTISHDIWYGPYRSEPLARAGLAREVAAREAAFEEYLKLSEEFS